MPVIPIRNFTRYNTDDLIAIQVRVEAYLVTRGAPLTALNRVDNIEFHHYEPGDPSAKNKKWNGKGYDVTETRKYVGAMSYARPERVQLLVPKLLYENPLEALAVSSDAEIAPAEMVQRIAMDIVRRYEFDEWHYRDSSGKAELTTDGLTLRIEAKVQSKKPNSLREREKARRALQANFHAGYELRAALHAFGRYYNGVEQANKHYATEEGASLQVMAAEVHAALNNMLLFHEAQVGATLKDKHTQLAREV
jgi:hypothetical protein